jgi:hypothetical protein
MGRLSYPLDPELTGPDRVVLGFLQKDYERYDDAPAKPILEAVEDSDDSGTKHSEFVVPSPEGTLHLFPSRVGFRGRMMWLQSTLSIVGSTCG